MANDRQITDTSEALVDKAVAEGGAYEVIKKRLLEQGKKLETSARELNKERLSEFGSSEMAVAARVRVRTENNCIARDIVQVGKYLLFGYNVYIGLKKETHIDDVFALFTLSGEAGNTELTQVPLAGLFLTDQRFVQDFGELYRYYKSTKLVELTVKSGKLLWAFKLAKSWKIAACFVGRYRPMAQRWSISTIAESAISNCHRPMILNGLSVPAKTPYMADTHTLIFSTEYLWKPLVETLRLRSKITLKMARAYTVKPLRIKPSLLMMPNTAMPSLAT